MTVSPLHSPPQTSTHQPFGADSFDPRWQLSAGDRISPPRRGGFGRFMLRGGAVVVFALGTAWAIVGEEALLPPWLKTELGTLFAAMERQARAAIERPATPLPPAELPADAAQPPQPRPAAESAAAPPLPPPSSPPPATTVPPAPTAPPQQLTTAALAPTEAQTEEPSPAPTKAPLSDPHQMRAQAAGLHPDLSRAVLERLTATDLRNAGIAIGTAMAETSDAGTYVWPRQRKAGLAIFEVRFVPGAAAECRRYVVNVVLDGWATTAMPVEKCGIKRRTARRE